MKLPTPEELLAAGYHPLCPAREVSPIMPRRIQLGAAALLLCRADDLTYYTVDELCPHRQESMAMGLVHEGALICPHHQYAFDLKTGASSAPRCPALTTYPTRLDDHGDLWVKLPQESGEA